MALSKQRAFALGALALNLLSFLVRYRVYNVAFTAEELMPIVASIFFSVWAAGSTMMGWADGPSPFEGFIGALLLAGHAGSWAPTDPRKGGDAMYPVAAAAAGWVTGLVLMRALGANEAAARDEDAKAKTA